MIDIHNHILFDIDDGAKNIEASVQMCRDAYENGIEHIVLTPHFVKFSDIENFLEERDNKIFELRNILRAERIHVKLYSGAELYLSDGVFNADNLDELTLGNSRYILCEFPLGPFNINHVPEWIDELIDRGYVPVIAHPERYREFHRNLFIIDELIDRDVVFQVNLDSVIGLNGRSAQAMSVDMLERGIAKLIGTDAHHPIYRHNKIKEKFADLPEEITEEIITECMKINPKRILENRNI
jgi:protein-tyrosine phosphatase